MIFMSFMVNIRKEYNHEDKMSMKKKGGGTDFTDEAEERGDGMLESWNIGFSLV